MDFAKLSGFRIDAQKHLLNKVLGHSGNARHSCMFGYKNGIRTCKKQTQFKRITRGLNIILRSETPKEASSTYSSPIQKRCRSIFVFGSGREDCSLAESPAFLNPDC